MGWVLDKMMRAEYGVALADGIKPAGFETSYMILDQVKTAHVGAVEGVCRRGVRKALSSGPTLGLPHFLTVSTP